ncbi:MAG: class I SAM-dependent methyltransferase [Pseudomonadaceae bacterium]|nr:class I SAM-dependent methyltransferase [Pseudomonadaceae bacterium]
MLTNLLRSLIPTLGTITDSRREAWVKANLAALPQGARLLDAGAGECRFKPDCAHLTYVGQDFGQYEGGGEHGENPENWDTGKLDLVCDITNIPEKDRSFDAILCTEVIEHVPDPLAALRELSRLAKPGATLLLTAPFVSATHFAPYHFCTGFSWYFYQHHLPKMGWKIEETTIAGDFYESLAQEVRRIPSFARANNQSLPITSKAAIWLMLVVLQKLHRTRNPDNHFLPHNVFVRAIKQKTKAV